MFEDFHFFSDALPKKLQEKRYKVIQNMMRFILSCVDDCLTSSYEVNAKKDFYQNIDSILFKYFRDIENNNSYKCKEKHNKQYNTKDLISLGIRRGMRLNFVSKICIDKSIITSKELNDVLINEFQACEYSYEEPKVFNVEDAYQIALNNLLRIETAIVFLTFIKEALNFRKQFNKPLEGEYVISNKLLNKFYYYLMNILFFGYLSGEKFNWEATKIAAKRLLFKSQIEIKDRKYLQHHITVPRGYLFHYNEHILRNAIKQYDHLSKHFNNSSIQ